MNKKNKFILIALSFLLLFVTGCSQQSYFIKVNEDDTVNFAVELSVPDKVIKKIDELNIQREAILDSKEPLFEEIKKIYGLRGFSYSYKEDDTMIKVTFQKVYPSVANFNEELKELYDEGLIGLGININRSNKLSGVKTTYNGALKYVFDPDFINELKDNEHLGEFLKDTQITSYVTIYDKDDLVAQDSLEIGDGDYNTMVNGTWDMKLDQPLKTFGLATEQKNQLFAIFSFIAIVGVVLFLVVVILGRKVNVAAFIKNKMAERKDN